MIRVEAVVIRERVLLQRSGTEIQRRHLGLGLVQPSAIDLDSFFEITNGGEVLIDRGAIILAELFLQTFGFILHAIENGIGVRHRVAASVASLLIFDAEQSIKNGLRTDLGVDRRFVAAPRQGRLTLDR